MSDAVLTGVFRLGRDTECRYLPSGEAIANLSLAHNYGKRKEDGTRATTWIDAGLWGKRAEALATHLTKGATVFAVLEDLHIEEFERRDGGTGSKLVARVMALEFVGSRAERERGAEQQQASRPSAPPAAAPARAPAPAPKAAPKSGTGFDDMDDDIPF